MKSQKQNILFLEQFGNHIGGGQIILLGILEYLQKTDQWNIFVSLPEEGIFTDLLRSKGFECLITPMVKHSIKSSFLIDISIYSLTSIRSAFQLSKLIRRHKIKIIYCNGGRTFMSSILLSFIHPVSLYWHVHLIFDQRKKKMVTIFGKSRKVKQLIAVSDIARDIFKGDTVYYKTSVIPNWVRSDLLSNSITKRPSRPNQALRVVVVGLISHEKGQSKLLETLLALDSPLNIELNFAGKSQPEDLDHDQKFNNLIDQLSKKGWKINAVGYQSNIRELLDKMDVLLISSLVQESFGLTAIEAMSREVIVVANDVGALPEIIKDGFNGLLYSASTRNSLVKILKKLLNNEYDLPTMRKNGLQTVTENYNPETQIKKIDFLLWQSINKPMNILQLNGRSDIGGGPQHLFRLMKMIDKTKFCFTVACPNDPPFYPLLKEINDISVFAFNLRRLKWDNIRPILKLIKARDIHVIHSQGKAAGLWGRLLKLFFPRLIIVHQFHGIHYKHYQKKYQYLYMLYESILSFMTNNFIFVSNSEFKEAKSVMRFNEKKALVINNGVQSEIESQESKHQLRSKLGLSQKSFIGISLSRFSFQKNIIATLEIIEEFKFLEIPLHFVIVGGEDDILKKDIIGEIEKRNINEMITLVGETLDVYPWLFASDFYLSTARWEGLPLSILEAMSTKLPVIASDVVGNDCLVSEDTGYLIPADRLNQFRDAIIELHANEQLRKDLGNKGKEFVEKNYSIHAMVDKHEKFYDSLIKSK